MKTFSVFCEATCFSLRLKTVDFESLFIYLIGFGFYFKTNEKRRPLMRLVGMPLISGVSAFHYFWKQLLTQFYLHNSISNKKALIEIESNVTVRSNCSYLIVS